MQPREPDGLPDEEAELIREALAAPESADVPVVWDAIEACLTSAPEVNHVNRTAADQDRAS